jgi:hypothetical protein
MLLVAVGLLFGLVMLLWCFVLTIVHRDSAWRGYKTCADDRETGSMARRSHAA